MVYGIILGNCQAFSRILRDRRFRVGVCSGSSVSGHIIGVSSSSKVASPVWLWVVVSLGVGVDSSWYGKDDIVSWSWDELGCMLEPARWDQRSVRFRLPFAEVGLSGVGDDNVGKKCISSVSMASC
jgi:hypothetical protein